MWPNDRIQKWLEDIDKSPCGIDLASKLPRSQYNQPFTGCDGTINRTLVATSTSEDPEDPLRKGPCSGAHRDKVIILESHFLSFSLLDLTASSLINELFGDVNSQSKFSSLGTDDLCAPDTGGNCVMISFWFFLKIKTLVLGSF